MLRRRATQEELREGGRQIALAHVRMQLEATEVPVEDSPAAGLAEEPHGLPVVEAQLRGQRPEMVDRGIGKGKGARDGGDGMNRDMVAQTPMMREAAQSRGS